MIQVNFSGWDRRRNYRICGFGDQDIEGCFELLSGLVAAGWQLTSVYLMDYSGSKTNLPVEAFDGSSMHEHLQALQDQWEKVLCHY